MQTPTTPIDPATRDFIALRARQLHHIADIAGLRLRCEAGSLWITLDHDPRDIVLEAGQDFAAGAGMHRHAIVYALAPSQLMVLAPERRSVETNEKREASSDMPQPGRFELARLMRRPWRQGLGGASSV